MVSYRALFRRVESRLAGAGDGMPELEARELVCLSARRTGARADADRFLTFRDEPAPAGAEAELEELLRRRLGGEPLAYILGEWDFYGLRFRITPSVLIPRPDTETLAERSLACLREAPDGEAQVLDLCCGSGCVGVAVLANARRAFCTFADLSDAALRVASENIRRHGLGDRSECVRADALAPPPLAWRGRFFLIACNPPYVRTAEIPGLDASVRAYEPRMALDGGADGLDFYRAVLPGFRETLVPGGRMLLECGAGQAEAVAAEAERSGYRSFEYVCDLTGIRRVVACRK